MYLIIAALFATGTLWLYVHMTRVDDAMPSPLEPWAMKLHGAAAMGILYFAGTMLHGHMLHGWHNRRNRLAGGVTALVFGMLAVTGYGLYYFGGDAVRSVTEWGHWIAGFGTPPLLFWHIVTGRRRRQTPILSRNDRRHEAHATRHRSKPDADTRP
ncbi:hypothetical protein [Pandoraea terrae]|uniref:hypothetical protein n=1 Tax=Pandoraea terrae TaxID=1537710 RepID=UPI00123EF089|nr:hypothetical protein [Pandoraea terrae]